MEPSEKPLKDLKAEHIGTTWRHKRTGGLYRIYMFVSMKDPQDSNWYQGVIYKAVDNSATTMYARYESNFLDKFEPVST